MQASKIAVYLMDKDLRVSDNPILHHMSTKKNHGYTHLLPVFAWNPGRIETSGFLAPNQQSPYPEARSKVLGFWRTGPHRLDFTAESVWNLKESLERLGSGLIQRIGRPHEVLQHLIDHYEKQGSTIAAVWVTSSYAIEEQEDHKRLKSLCAERGIDYQEHKDEKYLVDDVESGVEDAANCPDVFTTFSNAMKPLREKSKKTLPRPAKFSLPPMPENASIPAQPHPHIMPANLAELKDRLKCPLTDLYVGSSLMPTGVVTIRSLSGGEDAAEKRLQHYINSGAAKTYQETRNGLLGMDDSSKLSAYLALGCITARQIHAELLKLEDGTDEMYARTSGYGEGENTGTNKIRYELLWRDFLRLNAIKYGAKLFRLHGFKEGTGSEGTWLTPSREYAVPGQKPAPGRVSHMIRRFLEGTTGMGLIDASQRELFATGYTSNRARQNVACFFSKHLGIDWRIGAEWYECMLVDYDVASNWANWQYVAGVGNDPRSDRLFNPIKQALDYDKNGDYVRAWVPEVSQISELENVFQVCTTPAEELHRLGLLTNKMVFDPLKRLHFTKQHKPKRNRPQKGTHGNQMYASHTDDRPYRNPRAPFPVPAHVHAHAHASAQAQAQAQTGHHAFARGGLYHPQANGFQLNSQNLNSSLWVVPRGPPQQNGGSSSLSNDELSPDLTPPDVRHEGGPLFFWQRDNGRSNLQQSVPRANGQWSGSFASAPNDPQPALDNPLQAPDSSMPAPSNPMPALGGLKLPPSGQPTRQRVAEAEDPHTIYELKRPLLQRTWSGRALSSLHPEISFPVCECDPCDLPLVWESLMFSREA